MIFKERSDLEMGIIRRKRQNKRSIIVRFQPWLIAGGVILNVIASASAAISAYYSSQQSKLANEAANRESKNEAFSKFIQAQEALCNVNLTNEEWVYFPNINPMGVFEEVDYEKMESRRNNFNVDSYIARWAEKYNERERRYLEFQIWMTPQEQDEYYQIVNHMGIEYYKDQVSNSKAPPEVVVLLERLECTSRMYAGMAYYSRKDEYKPISDFLDGNGVYVWPRSHLSIDLEQRLANWGYEDTKPIIEKYLTNILEIPTEEQ